jgi:hypothetical protein
MALSKFVVLDRKMAYQNICNLLDKKMARKFGATRLSITTFSITTFSITLA